ncbi:discoidin domain-containing protein [Deinococcus sp.]|uniref:discoidin domain-containing protein n=1 Tax=Deinococcus sp. TaxID=47478 RepID=UPI00344CE8F0
MDWTVPGNAVDGDTPNPSRWSSQFSDPQWLQIDLGRPQVVCGVFRSSSSSAWPVRACCCTRTSIRVLAAELPLISECLALGHKNRKRGAKALPLMA